MNCLFALNKVIECNLDQQKQGMYFIVRFRKNSYILTDIQIIKWALRAQEGPNTL